MRIYRCPVAPLRELSTLYPQLSHSSGTSFGSHGRRASSPHSFVLGARPAWHTATAKHPVKQMRHWLCASATPAQLPICDANKSSETAHLSGRQRSLNVPYSAAPRLGPRMRLGAAFQQSRVQALSRLRNFGPMSTFRSATIDSPGRPLLPNYPSIIHFELPHKYVVYRIESVRTDQHVPRGNKQLPACCH